MHRIGEVDRRCAARQRDQPAFRREAEHLIMEEFELCMFEEFFGAVAFGQMRERLLQPFVCATFAALASPGPRRARPCTARAPRSRSGRYRSFGGADLQFDALAARTDNVVWIER